MPFERLIEEGRFKVPTPEKLTKFNGIVSPELKVILYRTEPWMSGHDFICKKEGSDNYFLANWYPAMNPPTYEEDGKGYTETRVIEKFISSETSTSSED